MTPLLANTPAVWMFTAGCALLSYLLLRRSFRYFGRRGNRRSSAYLERVARPKSEWDGMQRDAAAHIERQKVELHDMSRDLNGELSSRIIVLERLIAESSDQIRRMETLLDEMERAQAATAER
ncbi:MAG: hypothetical protein AAGA92_08275 [Planctomycetota bacterium]